MSDMMETKNALAFGAIMFATGTVCASLIFHFLGSGVIDPGIVGVLSGGVGVIFSRMYS